MTSPARFHIIDGHVDLIYYLTRHHPGKSLQDLPDSLCSLHRLAEGGVRLMLSAVYCQDACNGPLTASANLRSLLQYSRDYLKILPTITNAEELSACFQGSGTPGALLLLENADPLLEFDPIVLNGLGFRIVGLTHAGSNRIGCGNGVENPCGLTDAGRTLVARLDRLGMAIDTAHLSDPCFLEVAEIFSGPLVSTHTGIRAFCHTARNLSDLQIRTILNRNGVIGLAAYPGMLSPSGEADIGDFFKQLDWLIQRYGPWGIGIGSDFGGFDGACSGLEDHSRIPLLCGMLADAGYSDSVIAAVMGGNWFRFFSRLLAVSPPGVSLARPAGHQPFQ